MSNTPRAALPRLVCFDLAGVLCRFQPNARMHRLAEASGLTPDEVLARLTRTRLIERADHGELTLEQEFEIARTTLGLNCEYDAYRTMWCAAFEPIPETLEVARRAGEWAETAILTNNGPVLLDGLHHELAAVGALFSRHLASCQFGATKPSPALYAGVESRFAYRPAEIVLIDDTLANVEGARNHGWFGIHATTASQILDGLRGAGITA